MSLSLRSFHSAVFFLCSLTIGQAAVPDLPKITPADVAAYRAAHEAEWMSRVTASQPRLFYRPEEWPAVLTKIRSNTEPMATWRKNLFVAVDKTLPSPLPIYKTPEQLADDKENTLLIATEELWQRTVSYGMIPLALAAKISAEPQPYRTKLHDLVIAACHFDTWGRAILTNGDLAGAHVTIAISIAYDWHRDLFTEDEKQLIKKTIRERVPALLQGLYGKAFYANEYQANHNHISQSALGIAGTAFLGQIPEAADWLSGAMLDYTNVAKAMNPDGSSVEGVGYGSYGLNYIVLFIEAAKNVSDTSAFYEAPFLRNSGNYRLGCSTPDFARSVIWGDATGKDYDGPQQILYRLASQYRDGVIQYLSDKLPDQGTSLATRMLWYDPTVTATPPQNPDSLIPDWGVVCTRSGWGQDDYMLSIKGGLNNNHHSHLDAGALIFYYSGNWLLMAPGYGSGKRLPGFWDREEKRWNFFSNSTESHTALLINGRNQRFDAAARGEIETYISTPNQTWVEVKLTSAYHDVSSVYRRVFHRRGDYILVLDTISAAKPVTAEWLAQVPPTLASATDRGLIIAKGDRHLKVRDLAHAGSFTSRTASSPIVDIDSAKLKTFALKQEGKEISFSVLLQPGTTDRPAGNLITSQEVRDGTTFIHVSSPAWQDEFAFRPLSGSLTGGDKSTPIKTTAKQLYQRRAGKSLTGLFLSAATHAETPFFTFNSAQPVSLSMEAATDGAYLLTLATSLSGDFQPAAGLILCSAEKTPIKKEKPSSTLASGTYYLIPAKISSSN